MLIATTSPLQVGFEVIVSLLAAVGLVAGSYFIVKARKGTADDNEAVKTATLMTGQIAALTSAQQLLEADKRNLQTEIVHLHELRREDAKTAERNREDIVRLTEMVTQQAAVQQFRDEAFVWFEAIAKAVNAPPPHFPDHVSAPA